MYHKYLGRFVVISVAGMMVAFALHHSLTGVVAQGVRQSSSAGPADENAERSLQTRTLYKMLCQKCHDNDGTGRAAREHIKGIPDFTNAGWQAKRSNVQLRVSIRDGRGTLMPSFGDKIGEQQAADLVDFIRLFSPARKE
jgi:mono/diheme cytochrome c family protein